MKRVLLDECTPAPLAGVLREVEVHTVDSAGWKGLKNGQLVGAADLEFDVLITADKNLQYQQNLSERRVAIIELPFNSWPRLKSMVHLVQSALETIQPGGYLKIQPE